MRSKSSAAKLTVAVALFALTGCGGHHSSTNSDASSGRSACSVTMFTPNYASAVDLAYWPQFPLNVWFDTTSTSYTPDLQTRCIASFNTWVDQTGERVAYNVVANEADADITVGFLPLTDPLLANYDAEGITYFDAGSSSSSATPDEQFEHVRCYMGINGQTVRENGTMAHEFGHALGIHGHSPDSQDLMYYAWTPERSEIPTTRDVDTLYTAYCGEFTRAEIPTIGRAATRHRTPMPPITAPGWKAIP
jgi:predicted Zn-dependent protease